MPDSHSPYTGPGVHVMELLRSQLLSVADNRRRIMLWSALVALGSLMLLGRVSSIPWFLALVPLVLLALWNACLLVRQRRSQAAWESVLQKAESGAGSATISKAASVTAASAELGARDIPELLTAIASPSILIFHGLLLGAVVAGGATHEMDQHSDAVSHPVRALATAAGGGGCGCGGGGGSTTAAAGPERSARTVSSVPPRNFSAAPTRSPQNPQAISYPSRPPGTTRSPVLSPVMATPVPVPQATSPLPNQTTAKPASGTVPSPSRPMPVPSSPTASPSPSSPSGQPVTAPGPSVEAVPPSDTAATPPSSSPVESAKPD